MATDATYRSRLMRVLLALIAAPLVSTVIYTLIAFGTALFFPFVFFVAGTAFALTLLVFVPVYLVLLWKGWISFPVIVAAAFFVTLSVFLTAFVGMDQGFTTMQAAGKELVVDGQMTPAGYANALKNAVMVAILGAVGGAVFWLIAYLQGGKGGSNGIRK